MCPSPGSVLVGIVSMILVPENDMRNGITIRNMSKNMVYLAFCNDAEIDKGIVLYPKESFSMSPSDFSPAEICVIADKANSLVTYQEFNARMI